MISKYKKRPGHFWKGKLMRINYKNDLYQLKLKPYSLTFLLKFKRQDYEKSIMHITVGMSYDCRIRSEKGPQRKSHL